MACCGHHTSPQATRTLSESFAVVANRKHTLAVRNGVKFRGVLPIFGCQTLFSWQTFVTIRQTFGSRACFSAPHAVLLSRGVSPAWQAARRPCNPQTTPLLHVRRILTDAIDVYLCRGNGLESKRQTFLAKHMVGHRATTSTSPVARPLSCHLTHKFATWAKICVTKAKWRRYASQSNQMFLLRSWGSSHLAETPLRPYRPASRDRGETLWRAIMPCFCARCFLITTFFQLPPPFCGPQG
jgi:hypothetical protein